jgi:initiation factor 1A
MQRNVRGGKAYKKQKKHPVEGVKRDRFSGRDEGQDYGRVLAMLGDRRVRCFCNNGAERICKIRGRLCKGRNKKLISVGDIVLISPRDFVDSDSSDDDNTIKKSGGGPDSVWDIIDRIERDDWRAIKKEKGIHRDLFGVMADEGGAAYDDIFEDAGAGGAAADDGGAPQIELADEEVDVDAI